MPLRWFAHGFDELTVAQLYAIVQLRERVFVVEQKCVYLDADGVDPASRHIWAERDGTIVAYLRLVPAGVKYAEVSIGRVIVAPEERGKDVGRVLMVRGFLDSGGAPIRISAQAHLEKFYRSVGFVRASEPYDEDGIPHIEMLRPGGLATPEPL